MSDNYQAVYDAVRSRFHGCDVEQAVRQALSEAFYTGNSIHAIASEFESAAHEMQRPSAVFRPKLSQDGDMWCAMYGDDIQDGVCGFGKTPADAMRDFDKSFNGMPAKCAT